MVPRHELPMFATENNIGIKPPPPLADVLKANFPGRDERINALWQGLFYAVYSSGRYSWMGILDAEDELGRERRVIYLEERPPASQERRSPKADAIGPIFVELSLALRPKKVFVDLYQGCHGEDVDLVEAARNDIKLRYGNGDRNLQPELLWDGGFLPHR
ncbi:MAG: hypothetical protein HYV39_04065 [Candidatus Levybacteria bacterium]|nr:hypothetical protein [Candidatus Levybacteria bacterium]